MKETRLSFFISNFLRGTLATELFFYIETELEGSQVNKRNEQVVRELNSPVHSTATKRQIKLHRIAIRRKTSTSTTTMLTQILDVIVSTTPPWVGEEKRRNKCFSFFFLNDERMSEGTSKHLQQQRRLQLAQFSNVDDIVARPGAGMIKSSKIIVEKKQNRLHLIFIKGASKARDGLSLG